MEDTIEQFAIVQDQLASNPQNKAQQPLRHYVEQALQHYFAHLGDTTPCNLYELVLAEVEAPLLEVVLQKTQGNQTKAAKLLGLSRGTLYKKIKQYNLD